MDNEYGPDIIEIEDDEGNTFNLERVGDMDYNGSSFAAFLDADMDENVEPVVRRYAVCMRSFGDTLYGAVTRGVKRAFFGHDGDAVSDEFFCKNFVSRRLERNGLTAYGA